MKSVTITDLRARVTVDPETGCWNWNGARYRTGYPMAKIMGRVVYGHRLAYQLVHGPISDGHVIRHRCDNRACIAPDHLVSGTQRENLRDMSERGRSLIGEKSPLAKLTNEEATLIRARYAAGGVTLQQLADEYGTHVTTMSALVRGMTYRTAA